MDRGLLYQQPGQFAEGTVKYGHSAIVWDSFLSRNVRVGATKKNLYYWWLTSKLGTGQGPITKIFYILIYFIRSYDTF